MHLDHRVSICINFNRMKETLAINFEIKKQLGYSQSFIINSQDIIMGFYYLN